MHTETHIVCSYLYYPLGSVSLHSMDLCCPIVLSIVLWCIVEFACFYRFVTWCNCTTNKRMKASWPLLFTSCWICLKVLNLQFQWASCRKCIWVLSVNLRNYQVFLVVMYQLSNIISKKKKKSNGDILKLLVLSDKQLKTHRYLIYNYIKKNLKFSH